MDEGPPPWRWTPGKPKGKNTGEQEHRAEGESESETDNKGKGHGNQKRQGSEGADTFEGYCGYCGARGHKQRHCRKMGRVAGLGPEGGEDTGAPTLRGISLALLTPHRSRLVVDTSRRFEIVGLTIASMSPWN